MYSIYCPHQCTVVRILQYHHRRIVIILVTVITVFRARLYLFDAKYGIQLTAYNKLDELKSNKWKFVFSLFFSVVFLFYQFTVWCCLIELNGTDFFLLGQLVVKVKWQVKWINGASVKLNISYYLYLVGSTWLILFLFSDGVVYSTVRYKGNDIRISY